MRTIFLITCFSFFVSMGLAQKLVMDVLDPLGANAKMGSGVNSSEIVGSIYLTDWQDGYLVYGSKREKKTMRYNAFKDALHVKDANGKETIIQEGQVEQFIVVDKNIEYNFKWLNNIVKIKHGYMQVIYENQVKVYYRHHRRVRQSVSDTENYITSNQEDTFVQDDSYVIILPDGTSHLTKAKKKDILHIFADKKTEIETFIKTEKIDTQSLKGLMKIVEKYEELLKK